jgi:ADP-heptose:LPS heptosyltransferase
MLPWVNDVIEWRPIWQDVSGSLPFDPARELNFIDQLRAGKFDTAVIFTSFSQSPYPPAMACYLAGIPVRVGQSKEFGGQALSIEVKPPEDSGHQVDRNLHLLTQAGVPVFGRQIELVLPEEAQRCADEMLRDACVDPMAPFLMVVPGASCPARRYDLKRMASVVELLSRLINWPIVIAGSARELEDFKPITALAAPGKVISLVGQTNITEYAAQVRRAALVIANNSSALHIAEAFTRPMVVLYSGTEHTTQWEPRFSEHRLLRRAVWCSPCYLFRCPYEMNCLDIKPEDVVDAVLELLDHVYPDLLSYPATQDATSPTFIDDARKSRE